MRWVWLAVAAVALAGSATPVRAQLAELEPGEEEEVLEDYTVDPPIVRGRRGKGRRPPAPREGRPAAPPSRARPAEPRPLLVHVYLRRELDPALEAPIVRGLVAGADPGTYVPVPSRGRAASPAAAARDLAGADGRVAQAEALLRELDIAGAERELAAAIAAYEEHLPALATRDGGLRRLLDAHRLAAIARFLDGDEEAARRRLERCFALEPELDFDPAIFPPDMAAMVTEGRFLFDEFGRGEIEAGDGGERATVLVNGRAAGAAPARLAGVPAGPNYVTWLRPGRAPLTVTVTVEGAGHVAEAVPRFDELDRTEVVQALAAAAAEVGRPEIGRRLKAAHAAAGAPPFLLLVQARPAGDVLILAASLYDMEGGRLAGQAEREAPRDDPEAAARDLARAITTVDVTPAPPPVVAERRGWRWPKIPPVWEHPTFWPVVGATAAVAAIAIGIAASGGLSTGKKVIVLGISF